LHVRTSLTALFVLVPASLFAQRGPADSSANQGHDRPITISHAVRTSGTIHLDGKLTEPEWATAPVTDSFTQIDPDEGKPASQRMEVRVLYDDNFLYVGARMFDTGPVTGRLGRHDMDLGDSDWLGVMIDSYLDHRTAFGFDVNPAGVRHDEIKVIDKDDYSWDPVWEAATTVDSAGWTAEYRIPFSQLRFSGAREQVWGVQFERIIGRNHEYSVSTYIPKSIRGGVPQYGHLLGVRDIRAGKRLAALPYVVQRGSFVDPGANPFLHKPDYTTKLGLDLQYRVSSNLTMNAAFNPDFGQVEVDPAVVNLGVYETFFEEKRPFFIEGREIFTFGADGTSGNSLFYSRRIGRAPSLAPPTPASDVPDATTILGAAKVSGKSAGWSLGMFEAVTAREDARLLLDDGSAGSMTVEPMANYFVGRARRDYRSGQTLIGGIITAVNRDLGTPEARAALHNGAFAGGVDFRHQFGTRKWLLLGDAQFSRVQGSAGAITATQLRSNHYFQRPDAGHLGVDTLATSLTGYSATMSLVKQDGEHWRGFVGGGVVSPKFEVNDLGFASRTDRRDVQASVSYLEQRPGPTFRRWSVTAQARSEHNYDWQSIFNFAILNGSALTLGYVNLSASLQRTFETYDDRLTRGGPLSRRPAASIASFSVSTDGRKPVTLALSSSGTTVEFGAWGWSTGVKLGMKKSTRWNLTAGPTVSRNYTPAQYVTQVVDPAFTATFGRRYIFAPLVTTSLGLEARFNMTFSPVLSLETYVQPLLSAGDYGNATQLTAPGTFRFAPYAAQVPNRDFNFRSLRGNAVLRWEWRQGSTMYFAWQQRRSDSEPYGDFEVGRDQRALFNARPDNIFLVKVNYWFNL
jgi:hypothetical protein